MAKLIECSGNGTSRYLTNNHSNEDAVYNVIRYITRSRINESRRNELIGFGGLCVPTYDPENNDVPGLMISAMLFVQNCYHIDSRGGSRIYHESLSLSDEEYLSLGFHRDLELMNIAAQCSYAFCNDGFQTVYAVHYDTSKHAHIHFAVNAINSMTGLKFNTSKSLRTQREKLFNNLLYDEINRLRPSLSKAEIAQISNLQLINDHNKEYLGTKKYYGFFCNRAFGVYDSWHLLKLDIGDSNGSYKKFFSFEEATDYAYNGYTDLLLQYDKDFTMIDPHQISMNRIYTTRDLKRFA